jgi:hypothetical protein
MTWRPSLKLSRSAGRGRLRRGFRYGEVFPDGLKDARDFDGDTAGSQATCPVSHQWRTLQVSVTTCNAQAQLVTPDRSAPR